LIGPLDVPREARGLEALGLSAPLIGRDTELSRMLDCLERVVAGNAHVVRLIGDAGVGKSRLVREFLARVDEDERFGSVVVRRTAYSRISSRYAIACSSCAKNLTIRSLMLRLGASIVTLRSSERPPMESFSC